MPTSKPTPRKAGRPPLPNGNAKTVMLRVRVTVDERAAIGAAAKANNQKSAEWIRGTLAAAVES